MKMRGRGWRGALSLLVALSMAIALVPSAARAEEGPLPEVPLWSVDGGDEASEEVPEWAIDDGDHDDVVVTAQADFPTAYDMRTEGIVTPVKFQNPWGSCWAFGGIAAAETSILSANGTTYQDSGLDLSEKHLTWFGLQPITELEDPTQVGEGLHVFDNTPSGVFNAGGKSIIITTLFSQGVGPMPELAFPYRGKNAITTTQDFEDHADERTRAQIEEWAKAADASYEEYLAAVAAAMDMTEEQYFEAVKEELRQINASFVTYSENDDWSIPATNENGQSNRLFNGGLVLKDGNILPAYWHTQNDVPVQINNESISAIKQELLNGHAVSIAYHADQGEKYSRSDGELGDLFCQYVGEPASRDHSVCIVGWDDNYDASTFTHTTDTMGNPLVDNEGKPLTEEQAIALTTPPGNGAWIVKNSWGSTADAGPDDLGNVVNRLEYGAKNAEGEYTGYFYLSYYDMSIDRVETMDFSYNLGAQGFFATLQYDYMPSTAQFLGTQGTPYVQSTANVFSTDESIEVKSVSTRTAEANMRVTYAVYLLNDDAKIPTDGEMIMRTSRNYEFAGFHRLDLDRPFKVAAGKRFSIVSTTSKLNETGQRLYSFSVNMGFGREVVDQYNATAEAMNQQKMTYYSVAVVNPGESYAYDKSGWSDWTDALAEVRTMIPAYNGYAIDNFSIKAYADPVSFNPIHFEAQRPTCTEGGTIEYWYDPDTDTYFEDEACTKIISQEDTLVAALGHNWNKGKVTKKPAAGKPGTRTFTCKRCSLTRDEEIPAVAVSLTYGGHAQSVGTLPKATDGKTCGTTGRGKRLETLWAKASEGTIEYRAHVQGKGWEKTWAKDGKTSGTKGQSKRIEAIQMRLKNLAGFHVWYRVHSQSFGWLGWAKDGDPAGTAGLSKRVEAYQAVILADGQVPTGYDEGVPAYVGATVAKAHVQGVGWTGKVSAGLVGTTGKSRRLEAISIKLPAQLWKGSISYEVHAQGKGWMTRKANGKVAGTTGQSRRLEAVRMRLSGKVADHLSVWYRVHSQSFGWLGWAHDGGDAGTVGLSKQAEAVEVQLLPKGAVPLGYNANVAAIRTR